MGRWGAAGRVVAVLVAALGVAAVALAQTNAAPATAPEITQSVTLKELFQKGGVLMYPLAAMSVIGLAFVVYFFATLRREQTVPEVLRKDILAKVDDGLLADARTACNYRPCAFSEITVAALDFTAAHPDAEPTALKDVVEGEGTRQSTAIQSQIQYLLDVAVISPMIGLLGTVFGMIRAFNVVAFDLAKAKPMLLAAGVAEALITTAAGLIIGIPAMMFYAYFRGRTSRLVSDLEAASGQLVTALMRSRGRT
jgi:biopolymer transport protein ExbB